MKRIITIMAVLITVFAIQSCSKEALGGGYVLQVTYPNSSVIDLQVGQQMWALTSVPAACQPSSYDAQIVITKIEITGYNAQTGHYTYTTLGTSKAYIPADNNGGSLIKTQISQGFFQGYQFVIIDF